MSKLKARSVGHADVDPTTLIANPGNFRQHPTQQQKLLRKVLDRVGWVEDVIVNKTTGNLVDGHLRVALAIAEGEQTVPVSYVKLTQDQERIVLATLDKTTELAVADDSALVGLLDDIRNAGDGDLVSWMKDDGSPDKQPSQDEIDQATEALGDRFDGTGPEQIEVMCPECGESFGLSGMGITHDLHS